LGVWNQNLSRKSKGNVQKNSKDFLGNGEKTGSVDKFSPPPPLTCNERVKLWRKLGLSNRPSSARHCAVGSRVSILSMISTQIYRHVRISATMVVGRPPVPGIKSRDDDVIDSWCFAAMTSADGNRSFSEQ